MSARRQYEFDVSCIITVDDESLESVQRMVDARVNEMCAALERKDDIRIDLLRYCTVKEYN